MKIRPLFDRVLLEPATAEKETKFGFVLPTAAQEKSQIATVIAVGSGMLPDGKAMDMQVKADDRVIYAKFSGTEIEEDGRKFVIVRQTDILAVLD